MLKWLPPVRVGISTTSTVKAFRGSFTRSQRVDEWEGCYNVYFHMLFMGKKKQETGDLPHRETKQV